MNNDESMLHHVLVDSCKCIGMHYMCAYYAGTMHLFSCCPLNHLDATVTDPVTTPRARVATSARWPVQSMSVCKSKALLHKSKSACQRGIKNGAEDLAIALSRAWSVQRGLQLLWLGFVLR